MIDLDADAYMAAAQGPAAARDFYLGRMVLSKGARVRCADPATGREVSEGGSAGGEGACAAPAGSAERELSGHLLPAPLPRPASCPHLQPITAGVVRPVRRAPPDAPAGEAGPLSALPGAPGAAAPARAPHPAAHAGQR